MKYMAGSDIALTLKISKSVGFGAVMVTEFNKKFSR
jgi:hypothetical protein